MPKWTRKAKSLGITAPTAFGSSLAAVREEAARSNEDLRLALANEGISIEAIPPLTVESLDEIEALYRAHHETLRDVELIERLMALFLGQVVVERHGGEWVVYPGKYHTYSPFVVKLSSGDRFVDPFLFCGDLKGNRVLGARSHRALSMFVRHRESRSTR